MVKKIESREIPDMENLGKGTETTKASINNRIQELKERISGVEDTTEEIDSLVKENIKYNKLLTQNIQKVWSTMKKPNL